MPYQRTSNEVRELVIGALVQGDLRNVVSNDDCESYVIHVANNCGKLLNGERIFDN